MMECECDDNLANRARADSCCWYMNAYVVPEKTEKQMPQMLVMFCTNWDWSFASLQVPKSGG